MDDDLAWNVFDILANRNEWWVVEKKAARLSSEPQA